MPQETQASNPATQDSGVYYSIKKDGNIIKKSLQDVIDIAKDTWTTRDGVKIISLRGLQKIAEYENIVEKDFRTEISPTDANKQQHVVNVWLGFKGDDTKDNWVRGSGEASSLNTGKIVQTQQGKIYQEVEHVDSKYRFSMAEKRAFSRALLKMVSLYGFYSDVEAPEFQQHYPQQEAGNFDY